MNETPISHDINDISGTHEGENHIICDVANCIYNTENHQCSAKEVKVGPRFASSSDDTACVTFRP